MSQHVTCLARQRELFEASVAKFAFNTDRLFAWLFFFQWILGILFAVWLTPYSWEGEIRSIHFHVYTAIFLGGLAASLPIYLGWRHPGQVLNRYVVATAQMIFSILFIHLTGGRIETHFHIFGSMAFLAFYRDFRPILLATLITAFDHFFRGAFFPQSIYGVVAAEPWRAIEHAAWVVFEDIFLFISIRNGLKVVWTMSGKEAEIEAHLSGIEHSLIFSAKMSALGQMAGGLAHEINTPLAVITMEAEEIEDLLGKSISPEGTRSIEAIKETTGRIAEIITSLRLFARDGSTLPAQNVKVPSIIEDTLKFCRERFRTHGIKLSVVEPERFQTMTIDCRKIEISQVLLNLLNNAYDALETEGADHKWIKIEVREREREYEFSVTDSGNGIPKVLREKIMEPFFSTKPIGKGTGLGLSLSKGILDSHGGRLYIDTTNVNTRFVFVLPKVQKLKDSISAAA